LCLSCRRNASSPSRASRLCLTLSAGGRTRADLAVLQLPHHVGLVPGRLLNLHCIHRYVYAPPGFPHQDTVAQTMTYKWPLWLCLRKQGTLPASPLSTEEGGRFYLCRVESAWYKACVLVKDAQRLASRSRVQTVTHTHTHRPRPKEAQPLSQLDIRLIRHFDSSALMVRRWRLIGYFPNHLLPRSIFATI
jgi:hypothetical protein